MIRAAGIHDVDQIAALLRASFDPRLHDFMIYAQHGINRFIAVHLWTPTAGPARCFLVDADDNGQIRAFAEFHNEGNGVAFLSYICVADSARGNGHATQLISYFVASNPATTVLQLDVFAENDAARKLYNKLGFEPIGGTSWFVRELPMPGSTKALKMTNPVEAEAMHAYYGFCRHGVSWSGDNITIGRIGERTIRCFRHVDFADNALLGALGSIYPSARQAIFICSHENEERPSDAFLFHTSLRLSLTRSPIRKDKAQSSS